MFCRGCLFVLLAFVEPTFARAAQKPATLRWIEGQSGCTFSADDDGKYRYGMWTDDFGVTLAVDSDELRKATRRTKPTFTVLLTIHYRGRGLLAINPDGITLEFVKHDHDVQRAVNPDDLAQSFQADSDAFTAQVQREISKHPEKKAEEESELREHQANINDMLDFLLPQPPCGDH